MTGDAEVGDERTRRNDLVMRHVEEVRGRLQQQQQQQQMEYWR